MQVHVALGDVRERLLHDGPHSELVDAPHVVNDHAALDDELLLACVDGANADLHDAIGRQHRLKPREPDELRGPRPAMTLTGMP
jgi:hypothetical protein